MSRNSKTFLQILCVLILMSALSSAAYFIGSNFAKSFLSAGIGLTLVQWQSHYLNLILLVGILSSATLLTWYILARFFLRLDNATKVDKRSIWLTIAAVECLFCLVVPYIFSSYDHSLILNYKITLLFLGLYLIIGYWFGSIVLTPAPYKYTPVASSFIRRIKRR